jgi:8-oxo-dGTP diphosphatase
VVAAAVIDGAGRVLIAQRPPGKHLEGGWEFPGGKLEPGEDRRAGLARELREEIGITIKHPRPLIRIHHTYSYGQVFLDVWVVRIYEGVPKPLDGQELRWCMQHELASTDLLPADRPIVALLQLPERLIGTASQHYRVGPRVVGDNSTLLYGASCVDRQECIRAARAGADFLVLRYPLEPPVLINMCRSVLVPVFATGITLEDAWNCGATGVSEI